MTPEELQLQLLVNLLNEYGEAKFGDEWWPGNAEPWIGKDKADVLGRLLAKPM